jgi:hypothetical protein
VDKIIKPLEGFAVDISTLHLQPNNPRRGDIPALAKSLDQFGQVKPIVYRLEKIEGKSKRGRVVIAGNHTMQAAQELGWTRIAAVDASELTEEQARAFVLADNRISELGVTDEDALREYLSNTDISDPLLWEAAAYSQEEINRLLSSITQNHFDGFLDDLADGQGASWSGEMDMPDMFDERFVSFQVMMDEEDRREVMAKLKRLTDSGRYASNGEAVAKIIMGYE